MTRYIDANALIGALHNHAFLEGDDRSICYNIIQKQPTIDAETVRQGNWIKADSQQYFRKHYPCFTCSECGYRKDSQKKWNYCPNCGAKMVDPQESEVQDACG